MKRNLGGGHQFTIINTNQKEHKMKLLKCRMQFDVRITYDCCQIAWYSLDQRKVKTLISPEVTGKLDKSAIWPFRY